MMLAEDFLLMTFMMMKKFLFIPHLLRDVIISIQTSMSNFAKRFISKMIIWFFIFQLNMFNDID